MTISDIAKLSGVSKATVSRVINNSKHVSSNVRDNVLRIIEENNFKPSQVARSLSNKQTKLIGVIVPDISNTIFAKIINGIEIEGIKNNYNIILCNSMHQIETEINCLDVLLGKDIDGLIYNGFNLTKKVKDKLKLFKIPIVMIGIGDDELDFPIIRIDNYMAGFDVVTFLIKWGHRKIGMIHGPLDDPYAGKLRYSGFIDGLMENGVGINPNWLAVGTYKLADGYRSMSQILDNKEHPTAVFCANDEMAIGAIKCIKDRGLSVPMDISVIGFDNIDMAEIFSPSLTTVSQCFSLKGKKAMETIIEIINKTDCNKIKENDYKLVVRESVRKI